MARTASMTAQEAESLIGFTRGNLKFIGNYQMHLNMRKWLSAKGISAKYAETLERKEMVAIYNDVSDSKIRAHIAKMNLNGDNGDKTPTESTTLLHADQTPKTVTGMVTHVSDLSDIQAVLAKLGEFIAQGGVNKAQVEAIIDNRLAALPDLVAQLANVHVVKIERQGMESVQVEGHCHPKFHVLLKAMSARQANGFAPNIWLRGETGSGKTHAVGQAAKALGLEFRTNGAISMDHQLIGYRDANGVYHETPLAYAFGKPCVYLFDELDSSDNSPLLCLAGALANGKFEFPHGIIERHPDCIIIAASNTIGLGGNSEFVGRNKLDGAVRSRFPVRIDWNIDESLERNICGNIDWACRVQRARHKARAAGLKITIDPRMSQAGAALIAQGFSEDDVAEMTYLADLSEDQRKIVEG